MLNLDDFTVESDIFASFIQPTGKFTTGIFDQNLKNSRDLIHVFKSRNILYNTISLNLTSFSGPRLFTVTKVNTGKLLDQLSYCD